MWRCEGEDGYKIKWNDDKSSEEKRNGCQNNAQADTVPNKISITFQPEFQRYLDRSYYSEKGDLKLQEKLWTKAKVKKQNTNTLWSTEASEGVLQKMWFTALNTRWESRKQSGISRCTIIYFSRRIFLWFSVTATWLNAAQYSHPCSHITEVIIAVQHSTARSLLASLSWIHNFDTMKEPSLEQSVESYKKTISSTPFDIMISSLNVWMRQGCELCMWFELCMWVVIWEVIMWTECSWIIAIQRL
jgi:hypothetical protein